MNFSDIERLENLVSSKETTGNGFSSFQKQMFSEYLEKEKRKTIAKENPFDYFYEDVIAVALAFDFQTSLGEPYYKNASDDASTCLEICNEFRKLTSFSVVGWLPNALKFVDNLILHYIQECCKETPKPHQTYGVERARYAHLAEKGGYISTVGFYLHELYEMRNGLEHRTITHSNGKQELLPPRRNKVRYRVEKLYPDILRRILKTYKNIDNEKICTENG